MSDVLSACRDLYGFVAEHPFVAAACFAGVGGLLLVMSAGRREQ